jgi:hypothetical protein
LVTHQQEAVNRLRTQHDRLDRAIAKHMRTYALSEDDDPGGSLELAYRSTLKGLQEEMAEAAKSLADAERESEGEESQSARLRAAAVPVAEGLLAAWDSLPPERINVLLRQVLRYVTIHQEKELRPVPVWEPTPTRVL